MQAATLFDFGYYYLGLDDLAPFEVLLWFFVGDAILAQKANASRCLTFFCCAKRDSKMTIKTTRTAIAADSPYTIQAGESIARKGGNAVDIAIASALAATLTETLMCSLGGSCFIAIKSPNSPPVLIDGADAMPSGIPANADRKACLRPKTVPYGDGIKVSVGHESIAVPGCLKALEKAWARFGSLEWRDIVEPSIKLASTGVKATETLSIWLNMVGRDIFYDQDESRTSFFPNGQDPLTKDQVYTLPNYVQTLREIQKNGGRALYQGSLCEFFIREIEQNGGFVTREDMGEYDAIIRDPIVIDSNGFSLALNPPPAIGGSMLGSMIRMYESEFKLSWTDAQKNHLMAEVQKSMFNIRESESKDWNDEKAQEVLNADWVKRHIEKSFSPHTLHISVATEDGSVVAITMSNGYGSGISIPGTGIPANNSLGEPELNPGGFYSSPKGKRLVSNMSPTVAFSDSGAAIALGSPGASRITTTLFQTWVRVSHDKMPISRVVKYPRLHMEKVDNQFVAQHEEGLDTSLIKKRYQVRSFEGRNMYFGALNAAGIDERGELFVVSDDRRHGASKIIQ